ncbi:unnamed protein product [Closterium sp. Yama58-4]|nr:unnamed protein product [Closterium sp. Yama58-4]
MQKPRRLPAAPGALGNGGRTGGSGGGLERTRSGTWMGAAALNPQKEKLSGLRSPGSAPPATADKGGGETGRTGGGGPRSGSGGAGGVTPKGEKGRFGEGKWRFGFTSRQDAGATSSARVGPSSGLMGLSLSGGGGGGGGGDGPLKRMARRMFPPVPAPGSAKTSSLSLVGFGGYRALRGGSSGGVANAAASGAAAGGGMGSGSATASNSGGAATGAQAAGGAVKTEMLAFEIGCIMRRLLEIDDATSERSLAALRANLQAPGVVTLISPDLQLLWSLAGAEKAEELQSVALRVAVLGRKCRHPRLHSLGDMLDRLTAPAPPAPPAARAVPAAAPAGGAAGSGGAGGSSSASSSSSGRFAWAGGFAGARSGAAAAGAARGVGGGGGAEAAEIDLAQFTASATEAEALMRFMKEQAEATERLRAEMESIQQLHRRIQAYGEWNKLQDMVAQGKAIERLQSHCLWSLDLDFPVQLLVAALCLLRARILAAFGPAPAAPPPLCAVSLGVWGLALHYANVVVVLERIIQQPDAVMGKTRDELYDMLPRSIQHSLRCQLQNPVNFLPDGRVEANLKRGLLLLPTMAHNTIFWQSLHTPGTNMGTDEVVFQVQTFYYANRESMDVALVDVLLGLSPPPRHVLPP